MFCIKKGGEMNYTETLHTVDTLKALKLLGIEAEQKGAYFYFPCSCGDKKVIKAYGEKKNVFYCPKCKDSGHIIKLVTEIMNANDTEKWDFKKASDLLAEKAMTYGAPKIIRELTIDYKLQYHAFLKEQGISEELAADLGIGVPQGKTMLSGCVAFTVHDEQGMKIAYYGIRLKDQKAVFHKSFNPELYLYNWHRIQNDREVLFTTDIVDCVRLIGEGKQSISNFGLPYLSTTHLELLQRCKYIEFIVEDQQLQEFSKQVIPNLRNYYRFRFKDTN
jgi:hypothetical protein